MSYMWEFEWSYGEKVEKNLFLRAAEVGKMGIKLLAFTLQELYKRHNTTNTIHNQRLIALKGIWFDAVVEINREGLLSSHSATYSYHLYSSTIQCNYMVHTMRSKHII